MLAFDQTVFAQASLESSDQMRALVGRSRAKKADHRQRWLLRTRHEWPRRRRAAEQCHELASSHELPPRGTHLTTPKPLLCIAAQLIVEWQRWVLVVRKRAGGRTSTDRFRREAAVGLLSKINKFES